MSKTIWQVKLVPDIAAIAARVLVSACPVWILEKEFGDLKCLLS